MKKVFKEVTFMAVAAASLLVTGCSKDNDDYGNSPGPNPTINAVVLSASGDSAGILTKLNEFRLLAGNPLNTTPGQSAGRREVNWDGVPPTFTNNNTYPFDFFGSADPAAADGRKRGLILANTGTSFRIDSSAFAGIDASYAAQFQPFTKKKLFTGMSSNVTEVTFNVPGTNTTAFIKSFGVIFSDVDDANTSGVEYFAGTKSLGFYKAKAAAQGFSFIGVGFPDEKITRVKITSGNGLLISGTKDVSDGGNKDLVVMDDFLYDEPKQLN